MEDRLIEFASVLRRNGIRVSLAENMDAFRALELVGIADPALFRHTLRSTLVKRASDVKPFEELFYYFFLGIGQALGNRARSPAVAYFGAVKAANGRDAKARGG